MNEWQNKFWEACQNRDMRESTKQTLESNELTKSSIGFGKALSRAWMTTSCCWTGLNLCLATLAASTRPSYPLLLLITPAKDSNFIYRTSHWNEITTMDKRVLWYDCEPVASWTLFDRWFIAKRSNQLSL